jgi:integrating conjugative element relaxase (TIGR03760 family)
MFFIDKLFSQKVDETRQQASSLIRVMSAEQILDSDKNRVLMLQIRSLVSLPEETFDRYYLRVLHRYAEFVQQLSASRYHHHAFKGGLVTHTLEVIVFALKRKNKYAIPPDTPPENADETQQLWIWAIVTVSVLHDLGKSITDMLIILFDKDEKLLGRWSPYSGPITSNSNAAYYKVKYNPQPDYSFHTKLNGVFMRSIVPWDLLDWVSRELKLYNYFLNAISGDYKQASILGEIVQAADSDSTALSLGSDSGSLRLDGSAVGLHDKILSTIRHLFSQKKITFNRKGATAYRDEENIYVFAKTFTDAVKTQMQADGHKGVPSDNKRLFTIMQEHQIVDATAGGTAVWKSTIQLHDTNGVSTWENEFSLLRLKLDHVIPEREAQPETMRGIVIVKESDDPHLYAQRNAKDQPLPEALRETTVPVAPPTQQKDTANENDQDITVDDVSKNKDSESPATKTSVIPQGPKKIDRSQGDPSVNPSGDQSPKEKNSQLFVHWLRTIMGADTADYNTSTSPVHVVREEDQIHVFLASPKIFKLFAESINEPDSWAKYQKAFCSQGYHIKSTSNGGNIVSYLIKAKRGDPRKINGILVRDWKLVWDKEPPFNNLLYRS